LTCYYLSQLNCLRIDDEDDDSEIKLNIREFLHERVLNIIICYRIMIPLFSQGHTPGRQAAIRKGHQSAARSYLTWP